MPLAMPKKVVATYFTLWSGGSRITSVPMDYNQIYLFHATPASGGAFRFEYGSAVNAADIKTCQDRGQRVVLTVGGANAGFNFTSRAQSDAFVKSFISIVDSLGGNISGIDFNNFEAKIGSNPAEMIYIAQQLKAKYGADFSVTCPPAPGAGYAPMDRTLTKAMADAGVLTYAGPQYYDSQDLTQLATITSLTREWVKNVGGADKVVIGLSSNYDGGPSLATCQAAWKQMVQEFPDIRGVFAWSAQDDAGGGWSWGKTMGPLVGSKPVTGGGSTPPVTPPVTPPTTPIGDTYTVVSGDTLNKISAATGVSVANLVTWNNISDAEAIEVGQVLKLKNPNTGTTPPTGLQVNDRVKIDHLSSAYNGQTGVILSVKGTKATVRLDSGREFTLSWLKKI
jgi:LysM repeat protein